MEFYRGRVRPWMYTWGARDEEIAAALPGDELVDPHTPTSTRAVTIDAPVEAVWPWLAQIGEDRGGFYSYSLLERAFRADVHNAGAVHPEWQDVHVGDTVWLARRYGDEARQVVAAVKPKSHLVLVSPDDFERLQRGEKAAGTWSFHLHRESGWTRLLVRGSGGAMGHAAFDIPHFVMEQKMMRGIRRRAQQLRSDDTAAFARSLGAQRAMAPNMA
ncbi:hypothetical protein MycrhN_3254 [Mycolicibacterium rhodesiae NBB3]|uniref:Polyketide cyclase / dehydrase and lipid transport n=1 Tax=Mycolicibacterium rhodesiae (strain NBB3) TaxID=710685 RepID=G8RNS8_MYCRN|nr:hypothetical protein MycrhN_3254 [Mycolicibacterium rhodesiae NBB3]